MSATNETTASAMMPRGREHDQCFQEIAGLKKRADAAEAERDELVRWRHGLTRGWKSGHLYHITSRIDLGTHRLAEPDQCSECEWLVAHPLPESKS